MWAVMVSIGALATLALLAGALRRWPVLGAVMMSASVLVAWELPDPPPLTNVAGSNIYLFDVFASVFLLVGVLGLGQLARNLRAAAWFWLALGLLLAVSLMRGLSEFDYGTSLNEFRSFLYPYAALTWAMSLKWSPTLTLTLIRRSSLALGWGLVAITGYHILRFGFGGASEFVDSGTGFEQTLRPLVSGQAFVLLLCAIPIFWFWERERKTGLLVAGLVFMGAMAMVQQRTVWGVAVAVAVVVFMLSRASAKRSMVLAGIVMAWALAVVLTSGSAAKLLAQFTESATNSGTYDARVNSWLALIGQSLTQGPGSVIFGSSMGSGFGRFEGAGRWVEFAPHNWYITIYLRVGIVGLALLLIFLTMAVTQALRVRSNSAAIAVLAAMIVYGWSYSWPWYSSIFFSWAVVTGSSAMGPTQTSPREGTSMRPLAASTRDALLTSALTRFELQSNPGDK
jgi:hypothetical protein